ncbi:MAG: hypothetical protein Q9M40_10750 [Sulfurimonas sp.]|nr:hypothetical protein [Sulfurimonas sp.]MDQ7068399.1 hypothetical protein [Sulfurimonas sp.]
MKKLLLVLVLGMSFFFTSSIADMYSTPSQLSDMQEDKMSKESMQTMLTKMKNVSKKDKKVMKYNPKKSATKCGAVTIPTH